jgi:hypothetical protein
MKKFLRRWRLHLASLSLVIIVGILLTVPLWQLFPYLKTGQSQVKLTLIGSTLLAHFDLSSSDRANLTDLTKRINLPWQGQDLAIPLSQPTKERLSSSLPLSLSMGVPNSHEIDLSGTASTLPIATPGLTNEGQEFLPRQSLAVVRIPGLQDNYQLSGKEVFKSLSERGTLGVLIDQDKVGFIFAARIKNKAELDKTLAGLKDLPVTSGPGYSGVEGVAAGFSQAVVNGVGTYTLNQPGLAYQPTFGVLGDYLVVGSAPEIWQLARRSYETKQGINGESKYQDSISHLPTTSSGSIYLDLSQGAAKSKLTLTGLKSLVKVDLDNSWLSFGIRGESLKTLEVAWFGFKLGRTTTSARVVVRMVTSE